MAQSSERFWQNSANLVEKLWFVKEIVLHGETAEEKS